MTDKYIFHYFNCNYRGAIARAILSYGKANWEDHKFEGKEWPSLKKSGLFEFEQAPVLEHNGLKMAQSNAINLYLARKFNLMGKDDDENYQIDCLIACHEDVMQAIVTWTHTSDDKLLPVLKKIAKEKYIFFIKKLEERYVKNGKGKYYLGDRFTLCDIVLVVGFNTFCDLFGEKIVPRVSPILTEYIGRIMQNELKEYFDKYFIPEHKFKLTYFDVNGRAVIARAILSYARANWEDVRMKREEWPSIKKSGLCEFEQVPVLEHNGNKMAQSLAIVLYLARTFDLMGENTDENYQIESLLCVLEDLFPPFGKYKRCENAEEKEKLKKEALEKFEFFLKKIEERYVKNGKGKYFLGNKFTVCDVLIGSALPSFCDTLGECVAKKVAPTLAELVIRIKENELKEFHEKYFVKTK